MNVNPHELNRFEELWIASVNGTGERSISSLVDQLISDISNKILAHQAPLESLKNLYDLTMKQIQDNRSATDQTIINSTAIGILEGLILIISPAHEAAIPTKKGGGFIHDVNKINAIMKENPEDAKQAFQQLASKVLTHEMRIDSFVELSITPPKYEEQLCNWITSLCLLEKEIRYKKTN